jgi:hypothetical protein
MEGSDNELIRGTIPAFASGDWGPPGRMTGFRAVYEAGEVLTQLRRPVHDLQDV